MPQVATPHVGLGFACVPLARSGLGIELEVQICHLSERLLGKWLSMFFVLCFVFTAASISGPGAFPPWVLCRCWPTVQIFLTLSQVLSVLQQGAEFESRTSSCLCPLFSMARVLWG